MTQAHPTSGAVPDPDCPIPMEQLGAIYRAEAEDLPELLAVIPPLMRAKLAAYLYGKSHMHQLGLTVARTCERDDLVRAAGEIGAVIHGQSRLKPARPAAPAAAPPSGGGGRKISLGGASSKHLFD
ncbi:MULTISPECIES: hypothetical protein [Methylobacterium]|uniref:Uncharacterized protein n=1 Tax=Methylobacterium jeotgali TaxID=381630 RepID=A0ABQ4SWY8_9HYPH|nr:MULTISPECIES: hypothetical protein [Methylobacterium]PIU07543.1 MAG: hypothetical protein COT56_04805 [Methylobacterium sp. CG09_land_8_20_14_0_10_71_15]PIU13330.1 MAG: hypothetical protein COT28_11945 [Methylobacterium sp. CG08_land_8_20_14_0_20_71_15]GBU17757.1 hypothetical protein AwMethylo_19720 [Methylobacterium sp.]GJE06413.1 hypothetical protein AOPFMNJM_1731 [Methylobacterium jeotgali]